MSKVIDYDKIVRESFLKAQRDLGLRKEPVKAVVLREQDQGEKELGAYDILDNISIKSGEWGVKGTISFEELNLFSENLRKLAGASATIKDFGKIIAKLNQMLGFEERSIGAVSTGVSKEIESDAHSQNAQELTTALYFGNIIHSLLVKQASASVSGGIWEGFMANLLGGELAFKERGVAPIQDILDEAGAYISLKSIKEGSPIVGSKKNLAIAVASQPEVTYLIVQKSEGTQPFKISFKKFTINKNNFIQFITNDNDAISADGSLTEEAIGSLNKIAFDNVEGISGKKLFSKNQKITAAPSIEQQPATSETPEIAEKPKTPKELPPLEAYYQQLANDKAKVELKKQNKESFSDKELKKQFEIEIQKIKQDFLQKITNISKKVWEDDANAIKTSIENYKALFSDFIKENSGRITLEFGGPFKPINLTSEQEFVDSMKDFWIWPGASANIFKSTAYEKHIRTLINRELSLPDVSIVDTNAEQIEKALFVIDKYDYNPNKETPADRLTNFRSINDKLKKLNIDLITEINKIYQNTLPQGIKLGTTYKEIVQDALDPKKRGVQIYNKYKELVFKSFNARKELYREKHKIYLKALENILDPFFDWFKIVGEKTAELERTKAAERTKLTSDNYTSALSNQAFKTDIEEFWNLIAKSPYEDDKETLGEAQKKGASAQSSKFSLALSSVGKITDVDASTQDLIISEVDLQNVSSKNADILKNYIRPYYEAFKKITQGTREYFVADNPNGMAKVNEGIVGINKAQEKLKTDKGDFKKASELKELLNMTREAAIVLEMLQRMED